VDDIDEQVALDDRDGPEGLALDTERLDLDVVVAPLNVAPEVLDLVALVHPRLHRFEVVVGRRDRAGIGVGRPGLDARRDRREQRGRGALASAKVSVGGTTLAGTLVLRVRASGVGRVGEPALDMPRVLVQVDALGRGHQEHPRSADSSLHEVDEMGLSPPSARHLRENRLDELARVTFALGDLNVDDAVVEHEHLALDGVGVLERVRQVAARCSVRCEPEVCGVLDGLVAVDAAQPLLKLPERLRAVLGVRQGSIGVPPRDAEPVRVALAVDIDDIAREVRVPEPVDDEAHS